jgi:hypothetical protein
MREAFFRLSSFVVGPAGALVNTIRQRMNRTGIGLAGIEGVWWLPAAQPFVLPGQLALDLAQIGQAIFALFDVLTVTYGSPAGQACGLDQLLEYKLPPAIPRLIGPGRVLGVRPDFQLCVRDRRPYYQLVATELEICPSAHGFAHALQRGYGLDTDLAAAFARLLGGHELLFAGTSQWSEFLFEQLAFCHALAERGARARVLYDQPIAAIAERIRGGLAWQPPMFGIPARPAGWDDDLLGRIRAHGFERYLWPDAPSWPATVGDALVFRFGYFDCFATERLARMLDWQAAGATMLNPTVFYLDSKAVMAALQIAYIRQQIAARSPGALATLDRCIPETIVIEPEAIARLRREQYDWVIKYAGYDSGNQAWGGRSLQVGARRTPDEWARILDVCLELPWPVVAQRLAPSARVDIAYTKADGSIDWMRQGATRLRSFMLRHASAEQTDGQGISVAGTHLTVSSAAIQVSEGTDTVQAPVVFQQ